MNDSAKVAALYDRLLNSEKDKLEQENLTIHKRLQFPNQVFADINDWILSNIDLPENGRILDAGCGVGGTLFSLLGKTRTGVGITLSERQVEAATHHAKKLNVADRCTFIKHSYDDPLDERFDLIVSIEALIHSADLFASIHNLSQLLKPGGSLLIIEDMAVKTMAVTPITKIWKQSWSIKNIYSQQDYVEALETNALSISQSLNFSPFVTTKKWPMWLIRLTWSLVKTLPKGWTGAVDIFIGGWALEHLYRHQLVNYRVIIAQSTDFMTEK